MSLQLSFAHASATGPREENQDALRLVTPNPELAASKGYLFALADGVSQCADGGLAARASLQALALDYYATPPTWGWPRLWTACCWRKTAGCVSTAAGSRY